MPDQPAIKDLFYPCGRKIRVGDPVLLDGIAGTVASISEDSDWWDDPETPIGIYVLTPAYGLIRSYPGDPDLAFQAADPDLP